MINCEKGVLSKDDRKCKCLRNEYSYEFWEQQGGRMGGVQWREQEEIGRIEDVVGQVFKVRLVVMVWISDCILSIIGGCG